MSFTTNDFNVVLSDYNGHFIRLEELNTLCDLGIIKIDREKLESYKVETRTIKFN